VQEYDVLHRCSRRDLFRHAGLSQGGSHVTNPTRRKK